ncbi:hypothetical protein ACXYTP_17730 [Tsukamurella ocularis]
MTTTDSTTDATAETTEPAPDETQPEPDGADAPDDDGAAEDQDTDDELEGERGNEAAKYRRKLRATEAERDELRALLDAQRGQLLAAHIDPRLVAAAELDPADALDEHGIFDTKRAQSLATATRQALSLPTEPRIPAPVGTRGRQEGSLETPVTWSDITSGGRAKRA